MEVGSPYIKWYIYSISESEWIETSIDIIKMFHTNAQKQRDNALQQLQSVNMCAFPGEAQLDSDMNVLVVLQSDNTVEEEEEEESTLRYFFGRVVGCNSGVVSETRAAVDGRHVFVCGDLSAAAAAASALEAAKSVRVVQDLCVNHDGSEKLPASWTFTCSGRQFNSITFVWSLFLFPFPVAFLYCLLKYHPVKGVRACVLSK